MNEMFVWVALGSLAVSAASLTFTIVSSRKSAQRAKVHEIEERVSGKADSGTVSIHAGKIDLLEDRVSRLEAEIRHLPDMGTTHRMEVSIEQLRGEMKELAATLKPVAAIASRMQDEMLERARP